MNESIENKVKPSYPIDRFKSHGPDKMNKLTIGITTTPIETPNHVIKKKITRFSEKICSPIVSSKNKSSER